MYSLELFFFAGLLTLGVIINPLSAKIIMDSSSNLSHPTLNPVFLKLLLAGQTSNSPLNVLVLPLLSLLKSELESAAYAVRRPYPSYLYLSSEFGQTQGKSFYSKNILDIPADRVDLLKTEPFKKFKFVDPLDFTNENAVILTSKDKKMNQNNGLSDTIDLSKTDPIQNDDLKIESESDINVALDLIASLGIDDTLTETATGTDEICVSAEEEAEESPRIKVVRESAVLDGLDIDSLFDAFDLNLKDTDLNLEDIDLNFEDVDLNLDDLDLNLGDFDLNLDDLDLNSDDLNSNLDGLDLNLDSLDLNFDDVDLNLDGLDLNVADFDLSLDAVNLKNIADLEDYNTPDVSKAIAEKSIKEKKKYNTNWDINFGEDLDALLNFDIDIDFEDELGIELGSLSDTGPNKNRKTNPNEEKNKAKRKYNSVNKDLSIELIHPDLDAEFDTLFDHDSTLRLDVKSEVGSDLSFDVAFDLDKALDLDSLSNFDTKLNLDDRSELNLESNSDAGLVLEKGLGIDDGLSFKLNSNSDSKLDINKKNGIDTESVFNTKSNYGSDFHVDKKIDSSAESGFNFVTNSNPKLNFDTRGSIFNNNGLNIPPGLNPNWIPKPYAGINTDYGLINNQNSASQIFPSLGYGSVVEPVMISNTEGGLNFNTGLNSGNGAGFFPGLNANPEYGFNGFNSNGIPKPLINFGYGSAVATEVGSNNANFFNKGFNQNFGAQPSPGLGMNSGNIFNVGTNNAPVFSSGYDGPSGTDIKLNNAFFPRNEFQFNAGQNMFPSIPFNTGLGFNAGIVPNSAPIFGKYLNPKEFAEDEKFRQEMQHKGFLP